MPGASTTKSPRRAESFQAETQRNRILDAGKKLLLSGGPDAVVLRNVANSLGMHHSNVQYYYRTRQDLLVAIFDQEATKYIDEVTAAIEAAPKRKARVAALIDTILKLTRGPDTALWRLMIGTLDFNAEMAALHKKLVRDNADVLLAELKLIFPGLPAARRRRIVTILQITIGGLAVHFVHSAPGSAESRAMETNIRQALVELIELETAGL